MLFSSAKNISAIKNSMFGVLPRAMLFVPKDVTGALNADELSESHNQDISALRDLVKKRSKSSTDSLASTMKKSALGSGVDAVKEEAEKVNSTYKEITAAFAEKNYAVMEVQYNPSTLRMAGRGHGEITNMTGATDAAVTQAAIYSGRVMTRLSCELIFEQINVQDAFLMENLAPTAGNIASMAGNAMTKINIADGGSKNWFTEKTEAFKKRWGKTKYSVRVPVEGLLSLLNFRRSRQVIFFWSNMFFHGQLTSVNANYTMFNKLGDPVMAKVGITIEQGNDTSLYESDNYAWDQSFSAMFGSAGVSQYTQSADGSLMKAMKDKIVS